MFDLQNMPQGGDTYTEEIDIEHVNYLNLWDMEHVGIPDLFEAIAEYAPGNDTDDHVAAIAAQLGLLRDLVDGQKPADRYDILRSMTTIYENAVANGVHDSVNELQPYIDALTATEDFHISTPRVSIEIGKWFKELFPDENQPLYLSTLGSFTGAARVTLTRADFNKRMDQIRLLLHLTQPEVAQSTTTQVAFLERYMEHAPTITIAGEAAADSFKSRDELFITNYDGLKIDQKAQHL